MASDSSIAFQDDECEEITDKRSTSQRLFGSWERFPFSRTDTIFVRFQDMDREGYYGMRIGDLSSQPTLVQRITFYSSQQGHHLVQRTCHPNLVNPTDTSRTGDGVYFSYERTGAPLTKLYALIRGDVVAVASICKKLCYVFPEHAEKS
ncbi:hypothetical protein DPV78_001835 [Talaromyces pinophilus]|nr:hypothetical protein DPV78_001835 [Talaromyces pinophilus]